MCFDGLLKRLGGVGIRSRRKNSRATSKATGRAEKTPSFFVWEGVFLARETFVFVGGGVLGREKRLFSCGTGSFWFFFD